MTTRLITVYPVYVVTSMSVRPIIFSQKAAGLLCVDQSALHTHEHDLAKFHQFLFKFSLIFAFFNYYKYFLWEKFRHNCRATLTLKRFQKANSLILKKGAPQYEYRCKTCPKGGITISACEPPK